MSLAHTVRRGSQLVAGIGLLLPRAFYERKLLTQQRDWRSNPRTLANVRTIQAREPELKVYKEPGQAIRVLSPVHDQNPEGAVLLFNGKVSTGFTILELSRPWTGPFYSSLETDYYLAAANGVPVVPNDFYLDLQEREEFLRKLGLDENEELMADLPTKGWYGFWLQSVM